MVAACHALAAAATEFCPAQLQYTGSASPSRNATTYRYAIQALASRVAEGTIIADTDAGWFTWTQQPVQLTRTTYTTTFTYTSGDETPAPAPPPVNAAASAPPFPPPSCAKPFVSATVTDPKQPDFPRIVMDEGFGGLASSEIAVAVGPAGKLVDAWVWAGSGYSALDNAALRAARQSKYSGAISYCRPIAAMYLFRADFTSP